MKILTITCHDVYNTGASLQAYALSGYLKKIGHDVQIIDYKPDYLRHYQLWKVNNPKYDKPFIRELYCLAKLPGNIKEKYSKRKKNFDTFTSTYLPITESSYASNEELKGNVPQADVYFAGSDQIWNTLFRNGRDPAFYLDFAPDNSVKASYAASFATHEIASECQQFVKNQLKKLDKISVRESSGVKLAEMLGFFEVQQVVDPVFLLSRDEWNQISGKPISDQPYLFLYDFDTNEKIGKEARKMADANGWKVFSFLKNPWCDVSFEEEGPEMFLSLIQYAQLVMSNSFHATAFALIYEKLFYVFERKEQINMRMKDLVHSLDLEQKNDWIDYKKVNCLLQNQIEISKKYIDEVLKLAEKK